jgi:hypothetical protein
MRYSVECWQCGGGGKIAGCFEDCCSCDCDPEDPEECCAPHRCDICRGEGSYIVTELTDENYDRAIRLED